MSYGEKVVYRFPNDPACVTNSKGHHYEVATGWCVQCGHCPDLDDEDRNTLVSELANAIRAFYQSKLDKRT